MSVTVSLMPLALPLVPVVIGMRLVMGKENFDKMMKDLEVNEVIIPTIFDNKTDLIETIQQAGYKIEYDIAKQLKTYFKPLQYVKWEYKEGKWVAVFPVPNLEFMEEVEKKAGKKIFYKETYYNYMDGKNTAIFPTNMRDGNLLMQTLQEYGLEVQLTDHGDISCAIGETTFIFKPNADHLYEVEVNHTGELAVIEEHLSLLDQDYKRVVQNHVYQLVRERSKAHHLRIENEEVLEDDSILITLNIQE